MANKKTLLGGVQLKVENMSGFDKSFYHALTAPLGSIVPICKQMLLPGSAELRLKISATLPPLASDAFLRTHLKVEAFFQPFRNMYGGFQSWFSGEKVATLKTNQTPLGALSTAKLPRLNIISTATDAQGANIPTSRDAVNDVFGPHTLMDYFGVKEHLSGGNIILPWADPQISGYLNYSLFNIFPFICYQQIYDQWYRNKLIERPLFAPSAVNIADLTSRSTASNLPYCSFTSVRDFEVHLDQQNASQGAYGFRQTFYNVALLNGHLLELRQRNYGYDYFTTALPSAQDGAPMAVDTSSGNFTISALRTANVGQHWAEINQVAGPDYVQTCEARYGKKPSSMVAQRPVLLGSADFPMFTSGVEQTAPFDINSQQTGNPFEGLGARYGRAHAEGSDFVCKVDVDEPGYLMVMVSLVPEANYGQGIAHDMRIFTSFGGDSSTDLPCHLLEGAGLEPVYAEECGFDDSDTPNSLAGRAIFGYQPRYMWHKAGNTNLVSGLFRSGGSLESFIPQRVFTTQHQINTNFLKVRSTDLDNVTAVSGAISQYGVMIDSAIQLHIVEPLGESVMPSLSDPASEHGRSVYMSRGGQHV